MNNPKLHAVFPPSAAARWMNSPGCWQAEQKLREEAMARGEDLDTSSDYAKLGTLAHAVAEAMLFTEAAFPDALAMAKEKIKDERGAEELYEPDEAETREMENALAAYVTYCRTLSKPASCTRFVEVLVSMGALIPDLTEVWGTSDCMVYDSDSRHLWVIDLKYGAGVVVEAEDNPQLKIYAAAALGRLMAQGSPVDTVTAVIVQPRVTNECKRAEYKAMELLDFAFEVQAAVARCKEPDAPCVPGPWTKFCPAKFACKELKEQAMSVAKQEFSTDPITGDLQAPGNLTDAQLGELLTRGQLLEEWLSALRGEAQRRAEAGSTSITGWKLVAKRAQRQWAKDDKAIIRALRKATGKEVKPREFYEEKFLSPSKVEKKFGKGIIEDKLVTRVSSGYSLVPLSDARPPVELLSATDEFQPTRLGQTQNVNSENENEH